MGDGGGADEISDEFIVAAFQLEGRLFRDRLMRSHDPPDNAARRNGPHQIIKDGGDGDVNNGHDSSPAEFVRVPECR